MGDFINEYHEDHPHDRNLQHLQVGALVGHVPARDLVINKDDILNLTIALNTSNDVSEFIESI